MKHTHTHTKILNFLIKDPQGACQYPAVPGGRDSGVPCITCHQLHTGQGSWICFLQCPYLDFCLACLYTGLSVNCALPPWSLKPLSRTYGGGSLKILSYYPHSEALGPECTCSLLKTKCSSKYPCKILHQELTEIIGLWNTSWTKWQLSSDGRA